MKASDHFMNRVFLSLLLIIAFVPFIVQGFWAFPSGDDLSYAVLGAEYSLELVLNERSRINGRYMSNFLVLANPLRWDCITAFSWVAFVNLFLLFASIIFFVRKVARISLSNQLFWSALFFLICLAVLPGVNEAYYWYTGAVTYTLGLAIFIFWLGFSVHGYKLLTGLALQFVFSGFNEVLVVLGLIFLVAFYFIQEKKQVLIIATVFQVLLVIYVVSAPGNQHRTGLFQIDQGFLSLFMESVVYFFRFLIEWIFSLPVIAIALLIVALPIKYIPKVRFKLGLSFILASTLGLFVSVSAPIFMTGLLGQYRTAHMLGVLFLVTFFLLLMSIRWAFFRHVHYPILVKRVIPLLVISLFLWKNSFYAWNDFLQMKHVDFFDEQVDRMNLIEKCIKEEKKICELPLIHNRPELLFIYDLKHEENHWLNRVYNAYFHNKEMLILPKN